jgi:phage tail-like protein
MALGDRTDPFLNYRFGVEIEGLIVGGFSEASGLQVEVETEDYQEGGVNDYTHKLPKTLKHPSLVLKRGITDADALWKWRSAVGKPKAKIERKTVRIILLDTEGQDTISWRCLQAYPVKWNGPELKADGNTIAFESIELAHCGIERM